MKALILNQTAIQTAVNSARLSLFERQWTYCNKTMRHTAYKQYIYYKVGRTGRGHRICPPSCVLWAIRDLWPATDNEEYTGFKD